MVYSCFVVVKILVDGECCLNWPIALYFALNFGNAVEFLKVCALVFFESASVSALRGALFHCFSVAAYIVDALLFNCSAANQKGIYAIEVSSIALLVFQICIAVKCILRG